MPLFGSHLSVAGGLHHAARAAGQYGFTSLQIFTKAPSQWQGKEITSAQAAEFQTAVRENRIQCVVVHDSYLINLASSDEALWERSIAAFVDEIDRADLVGADYLVTHPGAHLGAGEPVGLARVAAGLDEIEQRRPGHRVQILLETTAGQGTSLGHRFEHLAAIISQAANPDRLGVCLDTCHVFAAGYALAPAAAYRAAFRDFDRLIGLDRLKVFHVNDSKKPLGSRVDRHEHVGRGHLGLEPFRLLVNDRRFRKHPMILETAKEVDPVEGDMDEVNLACLEGLRAKPRKNAWNRFKAWNRRGR